MNGETAIQARLTALLQATQAVISSLDIEEVLQGVVREAARVSGTPVVRLFLLDEDARVLRCRVGVGLPPEAERDLAIPVGESFSGQVAATGAPVAVADCRKDPRLRYPEHATTYGLVSYLGLPVKLGNRVVGVLVFNTAAPRTYTSDDIAFLCAFAQQSALAIQNARLYHQEQERQRQMEVVRAIGEEITRELDLSTLLRLIHERATALVGAVAGAVFLWDEADQVLIPWAWSGLGGWVAEMRLRPGEGLAGTVAQRREGMINNEYRVSPYASPILLERSRVVAVLAEPLLYRDRLVGVITVHHEEPGRHFTEADQSLVRLLASQAAIAIENARLYQAAQLELAERQQVEAMLRESEQRYRSIVETAAEGIWMVDADWQTTFVNSRMTEMLSYSREEMLGRTPFSFMEESQATTEEALVRSRQGLIHSAEAWLRRKDARPLYVLVNSSPIFDAAGQLVGSFAMLTDLTPRKRAEEALVRRTRQLEAVRAVGTEITRELDLTGLLELIHRRAAELLGAKSGAVFLWDEATGTLVPRAWQGLGEWMGAVRLRLGEGVAGTVAERREGMLVTDYRTSPYRNPVFLERTGMTSVVAEPLLYRDRVVGVLSMDNEGMDRTFTEEDRETLALFSAQAAIAIENARLYAETVRQLEDMRALYDASRATASSLALDERLEAILVQLTRVMQADRAMVALVDDPESDRCRLRLGYDRSKADPWLRHLDLSMLKYPEIRSAIQAQRPLIIPDVRKEPLLASVRGALECVDLRSLLVLPLLARGRAIGAITLGYVGHGRTLTQEEIRFCQGMADISATAIANAQLFEQVSRAKVEWEHTFDSIPDLVAVTDAEDRLVRGNRALAERLKVAPKSLVGHRCSAVIPCHRAGCGATDAFQEVEDPGLGGTFVVTSSPLRDPVGQLVGHVCIARDVTEMKRLEEESRQRQRFEDLSRSKSAFIATMSHELRTPLNSVIGFADLLLGEGVGPLTEKQTRYLGHIHQSGKHLLHLISDILDLSKIEAEKFQLQCEAISVPVTLEDILVIARGLAHKKSQTIRADVSPDLPLLHADPIRFKQILFNLLSNAVKFTPESGTITVRAFQQAAGSRQQAEGREAGGPAEALLPTADCRVPPGWPSLVIEVKDTGVGIKAEDLPRLFQEFVQLEATQDKRQEGTGLGLALTKQLVEMHGGRIWAESEGEGKGSTFGVRLPFAVPAKPGE